MKMRHRPVHALLAGAAVLPILWHAAPALAEQARASNTAAAESATRLEEVTVTARKREERLQDVPIAVTAFNAETIAREQMRDVRDIAQITPNLVINPVTLQANGAAVYIRGFGQQDIDRTYAPAVSIVLDGVVQGSSTSQQLLNVYDLAQVEVLRGPQGTLFGPNSIGGVILLERPKPSGKFGANASATFGTFGRHDFKGAVDFPLIPGVLAGRIAAASLRDDGPYINDFDNQHRGFKDFQAVTASLLYTGSKLTVQATGDYTHDRSDWGVLHNLSNKFDLWCGTLGFCFDPNRSLLHVNQHGPTYLRSDSYGAILKIGYELGPNTTLTAISGYHRVHERKQTNFDGLPVPLFSSVQPVDEEQVSQEVRINAHPFKGLNLTGGLYYAYDDYDDGGNTLYIFTLFGLPPGTTEIVAKNQRTNSYGVFAQGDYQITDRLSLTAGFRFTNETKRYIYRQGFGKEGDFFPVFNNFFNIDSGHHTWTQATPRIGLNYKITSDVLTYVSFAQGFKSGGYNGRGNSVDTIGPYNPETVDAYEIGLKGEFFDRRLRLNLAGFYNNYRNKQEAVVRRNLMTGATITPTVNAGKATIKGLEAEAEFAPGHGFTLRGSAAFLDAHYDSFNYDGSDAASFVKLLVTPKFEASITPNYRVALGPGSLDVSATYSYRSAFETELGPRYDGGVGPLWNDPRGHVGAHGNLNASVSYEFGYDGATYKMTFFGRNLSNAIYIAAAAGAANLFTLGTPNYPRTYGLELAAKF